MYMSGTLLDYIYIVSGWGNTIDLIKAPISFWNKVLLTDGCAKYGGNQVSIVSLGVDSIFPANYSICLGPFIMAVLWPYKSY